jgi:hypothetical protein
MQTYDQHSGCAWTEPRGGVSSVTSTTRRAEIPFDPCRLPVFTRRRFASPTPTPKKRSASPRKIWTPSPRQAPLIPASPTPTKSRGETRGAVSSEALRVQSPTPSFESESDLSYSVPDSPSTFEPAADPSAIPPSPTPTHIRFDDRGYPYQPSGGRRAATEGAWTDATPSLGWSTPKGDRSRHGSTPSESLLQTPSTPHSLPHDRGLLRPVRAEMSTPGSNPFPTPVSMPDTCERSTSPPERLSIRYLTPATPTQSNTRCDWRDVPYTPRTIRKQPYSAVPSTPNQTITSDLVPTMPIVSRQITSTEVQPAQPAPKLLHHVSSNGGPVAALKRYVQAKLLDPQLSGMSLFLHSPRRRVAFFSRKIRDKERETAKEWHQVAVSRESREVNHVGSMLISVNGGVGVKIVHAVHTMNLGSRNR